MTDWVVLVESASDITQAETPHKVLRVSDYVTKPSLFGGRRPYILNLSRSYAYQSEGYYASLLAEARGHRVSPSVHTMVELSKKELYRHALPELGERLKEALGKGAPKVESLFIAFSKPETAGYERLAREASDWFRTPALEVEFDEAAPHGISKIKMVSPHKLKAERRQFFLDSMQTYTSGRISQPKTRLPAKWSLAVLVDPNEKIAPSKPASIKRLSDVAAKMGVEVEIIDPTDLPSLAEFDALFIRTTTSIDNFTYKFALRAEQEGMPVIDDTQSMIRCTNKVYLKEILEKAHLPIPATEILDKKSDMQAVFEKLGNPVILKMPDGSFGTNMHKAKSVEELTSITKKLFDDTALVIAQEFMPTDFDWRIGVLNGEPLYASKYKMARGHWQIIKHGDGGKFTEGGFETMPVEDAPPEVVEVAVRAARLIGEGLYGVDLKETEKGVVIIEINDNPSIDHDVEGQSMKDELWRRIISWFSTRLEQRMNR
ncbi:RimK family protein [Hirschia litorea]|uniref:RimK family protein n=1 Tax=Hirschia litorea TaxID=1199156 RepID=A0ABW2IKT4_9PROT